MIYNITPSDKINTLFNKALDNKADKQTAEGGFVAGENAIADQRGIAIGLNAIASTSAADSDCPISIGNDSRTGAEGAIAIGNNNISLGIRSIGIGVNIKNEWDQAIAVGSQAQIISSDSIAIGADTKAGRVIEGESYPSIAIGKEAKASGIDSIAIGHKANALEQDDAIAIGSHAGTGDFSVAIGNLASSFNESVAVGYAAMAIETASIQLGSGTNETANSFQVWDRTLLKQCQPYGEAEGEHLYRTLLIPASAQYFINDVGYFIEINPKLWDSKGVLNIEQYYPFDKYDLEMSLLPTDLPGVTALEMIEAWEAAKIYPVGDGTNNIRAYGEIPKVILTPHIKVVCK